MLKIQNNLLIAGNKKFAFPAVRLSIGSKVYEISGEGKVVAPLVRSYAVEGLTVQIAVEMVSENLIRKYVKISSDKALATPDWVEADRQLLPDVELCRRRNMVYLPKASVSLQ